MQRKDGVIELAHEEAEPQTRVLETGRVRLRKVVRTELRHFSIPVRREELVVEQVDGEDLEPASPASLDGETVPFQEGRFVIPLCEEQVLFTKTPHVWQEVEVTRTFIEEHAQLRPRLRRERVQVEGPDVAAPEGSPDGLTS
ncbi:YsnF/AvaK domain-containing protein [Corallococcus llansteffanensis]|uniref:DUF2382 domain-containing protein n=1 Tax=Corallococcus llansteffanensis TaxID=2316731 RepID=A0A3A8PFX8_9BACT|nr:YsnF/AvaK domain-containing protein [Corallococcus llansteffanensis]RKH55233.1 DUF2382 domain-containing protein [Corallococcus llansteffanensis]